jgi:DNA-binding beta-propeller fold protein YncE
MNRDRTMQNLCLSSALVLVSLAPFVNAQTQTPGTLLAVNQNDVSLSIIDPITGKQTGLIQEDGRAKAHEVATSPDGKTVYLPIYGSAGVGHAGTDGHEMLVIDLPSRKLIKVVDFGHGVRPHEPVFDVQRNVLYVTTELDHSVTAIDPHTLEILYAIPTGQPESHMLALSHDGHFGYTANVGPGTVSVLDLESHKTLAIIPVAQHIQRIAISNDDKTIFVSDATAPRLAAIDTASRTVRTWVDLPVKGYGSEVSRDGKYLVLALPASKQVGLINLATMKLEKTVTVPPSPQEVLLSPDGTKAFVSCNTSSQVAVINTSNWSVMQLLPAQMWVDGLAWSSWK